MEKELWKGNEAIAEAAIRAGCDCFFGYPITPQSEVPEYMSAHLPKAGGVFVQSESEVAAINMVYGAAGAGMRAMTSSSSPGISLKQEGITYIAGAELPCVIVNCMRGGPGLGTIPEYYVDFEKWVPIMENPAKYFATPAVNLVWAMLEATKIIKEEGLKARAERHTKNAAAMHKALESIGLRILADAGCRASTLSCVIYPEGVDDAKFRAAMLDEGVVIAGALGAYAGKAFRIGHMGNATENDMIVALSAVERSLKACGANVELGKAVGTYIAEMKK